MFHSPLVRRVSLRALAAVVAAAVASGAFLAASSAAAQAPAPSTDSKGGSKLSATPNTLEKIDVKQGTGAEAVSGRPVVVHYTGWLYDGSKPDKKGAKFDSSVDRKEPFEFKLGNGDVIKGWDEGVQGMKVGGKRQLRVPPQLGYGMEAYLTSSPL